jgi:hypothetical protein
MNFNWNVYKIFKNGNRAKAPIQSFYFEGEKHDAIAHFKSINETKSDYLVLNADESQTRVKEDTVEKKFTTEKNRVLAKFLRRKKIGIEGRRCVGGLIYCKQSGWKWQWAALEAATSNYVAGLSDPFDSYEAAQAWMKEQINVST